MLVDVDRHGDLRLEEDVIAPYRDRPVPWGYGALSWVTYKRTYSRDGESWWQTCRRVVEGMMTIARIHCSTHGLPWSESEARALGREAFERMWQFKWTPPGRGLWMMGTRHVYERGGAGLNNCGFVSTRDIAARYSEPFRWMMDMAMLGVGVGFDTRGAGTVTIVEPTRGDDVHVIDDSREGWAAALSRLLDAFTGRGTLPAAWDYGRIRPRGTPLASFGGLASGPEPLRHMLETLEPLYQGYVGKPVDAPLIVDTMNVAGRCVTAGGVRRSAQIAFGSPDDPSFLDLKLDRERLSAWRWASNNSVLAEVGMDYREVARRTLVNGEPGYLWLENARAYGRMLDPPNHADAQAEGSNPCVEQTLWHKELCCLVETYPARHDDFDDYRRTLRVAYEYAKTVTLVPTHDPETNAVMMRNRRIGCSMTGIVQAINRFGYRRFFRWCDEGYRFIQRLDEELARRWGVPRSIKTTSVKPSGSVSLLSGATPGVHWEHAPYYLRRVRLAASHPLVAMCREAGYPVEPDAVSEDTAVVAFPIHIAHLGRRKADVSIWEKVDLAAQMQRYWSDNQVSVTAELDPEREGADVPRILSAYEDRLKALVFLPSRVHGYSQPPYEEIDETRYRDLVARLKPLTGTLEHEHELEARYCESALCQLEIGR